MCVLIGAGLVCSTACCTFIASQVPKNAPISHGHLGGMFLDRLASLKWKSLAQHVHVRSATMLSNLFCPIECLEDGKCCLLTDKDVLKLGLAKNSELVSTAEAIMDEARSIVRTHNLQANEAIPPLVLLDTRLVNFILKKGKKSRDGVEQASLPECYQIFLEEIKSLSGVTITNPWGGNVRLTSKTSEDSMPFTFLGGSL